MSEIIDLNTFANGALAERMNIELKAALSNLADMNTDPKKARKVTVTITLTTDDRRKVVNTSVQAKTTTAPAKNIETQLLMDYDKNGDVTGAELVSGEPGQFFMDHEGDVADDVGRKVADNKIIDLKAQSSSN